MGLETANYPSELDDANPTSSDSRREGDDHLRMIKKVIRNTLRDFNGPISESIFEHTWPVGRAMISTGGGGNPGNQVGGTWQLFGVVKTGDGTEAGYPADAQAAQFKGAWAYLWYRVA